MERASLFERKLVVPAIRDAFAKLDPRTLVRNPVMFTTAVVAAVASAILVRNIAAGSGDLLFEGQLVFWLWLTVLFGNFAEALAEGRGKAQAQSLRTTKDQLVALRIDRTGSTEEIPATQLRRGDIVLVCQGQVIPADGEVVAGVASVNEAAITGESAPVIREAGGDRSAVTAGTTVISDQIQVKVTAEPGSGFLDRMIALVEGASGQKTPNEIALTVLLTGLTLDLPCRGGHASGIRGLCGRRDRGAGADRAVRRAHPDDDIGAALGHRHCRDGPADPIQRARQSRAERSRRRAISARCCWTRRARSPSAIARLGEFVARCPAWPRPIWPTAARLASWPTTTPEGPLHRGAGQERFGLCPIAPRADRVHLADPHAGADRRAVAELRKGAVDAVLHATAWRHRRVAAAAASASRARAARGSGRAHRRRAGDGTGRWQLRWTVALLGVVYLKDVVKAGMRERFAELRRRWGSAR
jgi:K+-transporting ATPase ATPase B chain